MCGIVAIFAYGRDAQPVDQREVLAIRDAMERRGPDGAGYWRSGDHRVALGHRRLAIIDLSPNGHQPMELSGAGLHITFNGEIYNYRELRSELEQYGRVFRTDSDTEVILQAYAQFGRDCVNHFRGMYAFALWDERADGMFLARDPYGIKPLYYADDGSRVAIASQVKALLAGGRVANTPSAAGQVSFLLWGFITEPHTLFSGISALPAGSTLWIDRTGVRKPEKFWSVEKIFRAAEAQHREADGNAISSEQAHRTLRDALSESVNYHMVADVPVGIFLSAGLDSGTIASLASERKGNDLRTLTLGFDALRDTAADEVPLAEQVASGLGATHSTTWIGRDRFAQEHSRILAAMDQPTIDGVNVYFISQMAANAGLKVVLSGLGGDELFGGYPSFKQVPRLARALGPLHAVPMIGRGFRAISAPLMRRFTSPKYASLLEYGSSIEEAYLLRRGFFMPWELPQVLAPEIVEQGWAELDPVVRMREKVGGLSNTHAKIATLESVIYMRNQLLRDGDWAGMAHSIEIRFPLVDAVLLEQLSLLLTDRTRVGKQDMANTPLTPLPSAVLTRPKTGFTTPIRTWLLKDLPGDRQLLERGLRGWAKHVLQEQLTAPVTARELPISGAGSSPITF